MKRAYTWEDKREVIDALYKAWCLRYPDLRLGQFLICLAGKRDLFDLEDGEVLAQLEKGIETDG